MELRNYGAPLLRWWWLILAAILLASATGVYSTRDLPLAYQSRTTLIIGQSITNPNPSPGQFALEQQLALIYADMARREPVRRATMEALGLLELPDYVARALPDTQLIEITVTDSNPERARAVAAELANQLILRAPTHVLPEDQERLEFVNEQLSALEEDINTTEAQIDDLNAQLGDLNSAQQIADTERQISALELKLTSLQSNYASLLANTQKGALNTLSVIEAPELPTRPIGSNRATTILLAGALGGVLAALGAYVLEAMNETLNSGEEAGDLLKWPQLSEIPKIKAPPDPLTYVNERPLSHVADAFRTLRTNLDAIELGERVKSILVTSAGMGDGKSTVATNLALSLAKMHKRVVLVDADLHQSSFNIPHEKGLSDLLVDPANPTDYLVNWHFPHLFVLGKGSRPAETSEMLGSTAVDRVLTELMAMADVVIIDSPPLILSDALALATKVDGVVLVVRPQHTRRSQLARIRAQLAGVRAHVLGYVVNGSPSATLNYGQYYHESAAETGNGQRGWLSLKRPAKRDLNGGSRRPTAELPASRAPRRGESSEQ